MVNVHTNYSLHFYKLQKGFKVLKSLTVEAAVG